MKRKASRAANRKAGRGSRADATASPLATAALDQETIAYVSALAGALIQLDAAQRDWMAENEAATTTPALMSDAVWRSGAEAAMARLVSSARDLRISPVPASMEPLNELMGKVESQAQAMVQDYALALASKDPRIMKSVGLHANKMFSYIKQARSLIPR